MHKNDPRITLNQYKVNKYALYVLPMFPSPKFQFLALQKAFVELAASLRHVQQMTPKCHWTLQGQMDLIYIY